MFFKWATVFSVRPCGNELGRRGMRRIPAASEFHVPVVEPVTEFVCLYRVFIFVFSFFFWPFLRSVPVTGGIPSRNPRNPILV